MCNEYDLQCNRIAALKAFQIKLRQTNRSSFCSLGDKLVCHEDRIFSQVDQGCLKTVGTCGAFRLDENRVCFVLGLEETLG